MGACELCGAEKTSTRSVKMGRAIVDACSRCVDSMGLVTVAPIQKPSEIAQKMANHGGYSGTGKKGRDIMRKGKMELSGGFSKIITEAREKMGLDKRQLAHKMAEKINVIQAAESGRPPSDTVIKKFERALDITLMVETKPDENRMVGTGISRGMNLGDFFKD